MKILWSALLHRATITSTYYLVLNVNVLNVTLSIKACSHRAVRMQLDDEFLALETQLANLCPRERVDFSEVLKYDEAAVCDGQLQSDSFVVLDTNTPTDCHSQQLTVIPSN